MIPVASANLQSFHLVVPKHLSTIPQKRLFLLAKAIATVAPMVFPVKLHNAMERHLVAKTDVTNALCI